MIAMLLIGWVRASTSITQVNVIELDTVLLVKREHLNLPFRLILQVQNYLHPYIYPRLELCSEQCGNPLYDYEGWSFGLEYQYIPVQNYSGSIVRFRVTSDLKSGDLSALKMVVTFQEVDQLECGPNCERCIAGRCLCEKRTLGEYCSAYINQVQVGRMLGIDLQPSNYPTFIMFVINANLLYSISELLLELTAKGNQSFFIYTREVSPQFNVNQIATPFRYDNFNTVNKKDKVFLPVLNNNNNYLSLTIVRDTSLQQVSLGMFFLPKSSATNVWIVALIGGGIVLAMIFVSYLLYRFYRLRFFTNEQTFNAPVFNKYFPQVAFRELPQSANAVDCSICLQTFLPQTPIRVTYCKHIFDSNCFIAWISKNRTCPFCRESQSLPEVLPKYNQLLLHPGQDLTPSQLVQRLFKKLERVEENYSSQEIV